MEPLLENLRESYQGPAFADAAKCPICGGDSAKKFKAINIHPLKPNPFDLRRCLRCGHGWIDPMPTQGLLNHLYAAGSLSVIGEWGGEGMTTPEKECAARELPGDSGTYLELGVGQGSLYREFLQGGWQCVGIDPGDWASKFPGVCRAIGDVPADFKADVIVAFDVLEHVVDPVGTLTKLRTFAKPGARFYCAMPNVQSARAFWGRSRWRMMRPLGHVNYYSAESVRRATASAGFTVKNLRATDYTTLHFPRGFRDTFRVVIEASGFGDQWIATATA